MYKPCVRTRVLRWIDRFFPPLQKSLCICESTLFFGVSCSWEKEDLSLDLLRVQLTAFHFWRFAPEICRFGLNELAYHQPFQFRQRGSLEPLIRRADRWILAHEKHALH